MRLRLRNLIAVERHIDGYAGLGYSCNSINNVIFRKSPLCTIGEHQYIAYYDGDRYLTLGRRNIASDRWTVRRTGYRGATSDAHKSISLGADADGFLHISFNQHFSPLCYCMSVRPESMRLSMPKAMTGLLEQSVTYPEFYNLPDGSLLFAYRTGRSGSGDMVLNRYDLRSRRWQRLHDKLIDGEGERNAYWQMCVDKAGGIHLSWVWRETPHVETNHDLCYTFSPDGGNTWLRADGSMQPVPITLSNADCIMSIPQGSELINQTSMTVDNAGRPIIASYWRGQDDPGPRLKIVSYDGSRWHADNAGDIGGDFSLAGVGTKMIPLSRPLIIVHSGALVCIFRSAQRGNRVSAAVRPRPDAEWLIKDLTDYPVDAWEPTFDQSRLADGTLSLFVQRCSQGDGERSIASPPTPVRVIDLNLNTLISSQK